MACLEASLRLKTDLPVRHVTRRRGTCERRVVRMSASGPGAGHRSQATKLNAISYPHRLIDLDESEKQKLVDSAAERIRKQTEERERQLKQASSNTHMEHELKFGKMMESEGKYEVAIVHFEKVLKQAPHESYYQGEATLQKAFCLDKLGRTAEAKALYESLVRFRAPYPNIKRRAMQALFGSEGEGNDGGSEAASSPFDDYMYRMFLSGFAHYSMPKTKYVESEQEKMLMRVAPWAMLMMAPVLITWLLIARNS